MIHKLHNGWKMSNNLKTFVIGSGGASDGNESIEYISMCTCKLQSATEMIK